ncbi:MAG: YcjX family protein [Pseudomonadota bacterium]
MIIGDIVDGMTRGVERVGGAVSGLFFEPVVRLGVTGLSRAGKTVFITSLVANLLDRGRMPQLAAAAEGRIESVFLQPQPDDTVPRFDYETHLSDLTGPEPRWPDSTRHVSQLRLSMRVRPAGLLAGLQGPRTIHLDIVDYPGEWLLDLELMDLSYEAWSERVLARIEGRAEAENYCAASAEAASGERFNEGRARTLADAFTAYLKAARAAGYSDCTPGRFLLPGEMAGSPALTFAPLAKPARTPRGSLWREMQRRYDAYVARVVKPFFRDHFARIDRQIVLVDTLGAIHAGPPALEDLRGALADILAAFRPGRNAFLTRLLLGRRVERILFAATKADHLHHSQHPQLTAIMEALVREAKDRADFQGAHTEALALAALRATVEQQVNHDGETIDCVAGTLLEDGRRAAFYPGDLPDDPQRLLVPARDGAEAWLDADYKVMNFAPAEVTLKPGEGPPHIRLDRALQFLIGDRL